MIRPRIGSQRIFAHYCESVLIPLRRLIASVVLLLFLFNILGYGGLLLQLQRIANEKLTARLDDKHYDVGGSLTVKMPFAGYVEPDYMINTEIKRDGDIFRVINQRQYADTLYLVCIKDEASSKINGKINDFVQSFSGDDSDNQNIKVDFTKDYLTTIIGLSIIEQGWGKTIEHNLVQVVIPDAPVASLTHPPSELA